MAYANGEKPVQFGLIAEGPHYRQKSSRPDGQIPSRRYCAPVEAVRYAYSTLPDLLMKLRLTVAEVHQRLLRRGFKFDKKTLYRLASHEPLQTINAPIVGAVCDEFKIGLDDLLTWERPKPKLHRIDARTQARLGELMSKNNEGKLTHMEREEFEALGKVAEQLSLKNARALVATAKSGKRGPARRR
jgi:hypothetical protein